MWGTDGSILVVDDDEACRELHRQWLSEMGAVETAVDGEAALARADETVDLVVLDREMPRPDGVEVAERLRERGFSGYVVMVTGVQPDFDLVDIPVDDYLVKPITETDLTATIDRLRVRAGYHDQLRELCSLAAKKARLEVEKSADELAASPEYDRLTDDLAAQRQAVRDAFEAAGTDWLAAFEACVGPSPTRARSD